MENMHAKRLNYVPAIGSIRHHSTKLAVGWSMFDFIAGILHSGVGGSVIVVSFVFDCMHGIGDCTVAR